MDESRPEDDAPEPSSDPIEREELAGHAAVPLPAERLDRQPGEGEDMGFWEVVVERATESPAAESRPDLIPGATLVETGETQDQDRKLDRMLFVVLLAASLVGILAAFPFGWSIARQARDNPIPESALPVVLVMTVIVELIMSAVTISLGLSLGRRFQLGAPLIRDWLAGDPEAWKRIRDSLLPGFLVGLGLGVIDAFLAMAIHSDELARDTQFETPNVWVGLLASIGAAIREELWLRLGVMTILVWLLAKISQPFTGPRTDAPPSIIWSANFLAALLFAALHIPQAEMIFGLSMPLVVFVIFGNGMPGLVFGWLYWRLGIVAAIAAHFGLDLVLKVVLPLLAG